MRIVSRWRRGSQRLDGKSSARQPSIQLFVPFCRIAYQSPVATETSKTTNAINRPYAAATHTRAQDAIIVSTIRHDALLDVRTLTVPNPHTRKPSGPARERPPRVSPHRWLAPRRDGRYARSTRSRAAKVVVRVCRSRDITMNSGPLPTSRMHQSGTNMTNNESEEHREGHAH